MEVGSVLQGHSSAQVRLVTVDAPLRVRPPSPLRMGLAAFLDMPSQDSLLPSLTRRTRSAEASPTGQLRLRLARSQPSVCLLYADTGSHFSRTA